ncbi:MAG: NADH-quinone oxidoreductase subunit C [Holosporales bacterium]|jgi:NADH:ubiquinone oxidoreductase subunit C|nr:NADH-quinone oxidoreductase subunit C [Holosporales bacterium]
MSRNLHELLRTKLGDDEFIEAIEEEGGSLYLHVRPSSLLKCVSILQLDRILMFSSLVDCFAVNPPKHFSGENGDISIYYQLVSYLLGKHLFIITDIPDRKNAQSLTGVFWNSDWYEREIFEAFGVSFDDHPNMNPIFRT